MPPAFSHIPLVIVLLAQIAMAHAADLPLVLDIHDDHIEATLSLPDSAKLTRSDLSAYLQTLLNFTTPDGRLMTFELIGSGQTATLHIYPPDDITPAAFVISTNAPNHALQIHLRRDSAELRLGIGPPLFLGTLDSFKNSLTIEREFPPFSTRAATAFLASLRMLLSNATPFLILLLLSTTVTEPVNTLSAFAQAGLAIIAFFTGTSIALIFETHLAPSLFTSIFVATVAALSLHIWRPFETTPRLISVIAAGWITGVSWNNTWLPQGAFDQETLLTLSAAILPALIAIAVLALPSLLLLARPLPPVIFRGAATLCGVIVILLQLTALGRPA